MNKFADLAKSNLEREQEPTPEPTPTPVMDRGNTRMLGGRVPDPIFSEFAQAKLDAERATKLRRVTTEEGVEAFVRLLRDPRIRALWEAELREVRKERQQG